MNVIVTRPKHLSGSLIEKLKTLKANPIAFPLFDIKINQNLSNSDIAQQLQGCDIAIFTSPNAVFSVAKIMQTAMPYEWPDIIYGGIGSGTAEHLKKIGIKEVLYPKQKPYNSEQFLALECAKSSHHKRITLFKGFGGREVLAETLTKRGGIITTVNCYRREFLYAQNIDLFWQWFKIPIEVLILTSTESLFHLKEMSQLCPKPIWSFLQQIPIIVVGERSFKLAASLNFTNAIMALGADDESLLEAFSHIRK